MYARITEDGNRSIDGYKSHVVYGNWTPDLYKNRTASALNL